MPREIWRLIVLWDRSNHWLQTSGCQKMYVACKKEDTCLPSIGSQDYTERPKNFLLLMMCYQVRHVYHGMTSLLLSHPFDASTRHYFNEIKPRVSTCHLVSFRLCSRPRLCVLWHPKSFQSLARPSLWVLKDSQSAVGQAAICKSFVNLKVFIIISLRKLGRMRDKPLQDQQALIRAFDPIEQQYPLEQQEFFLHH